ncbi:MAG: alanine/glycine:cation symporter family protein [bacterium]
MFPGRLARFGPCLPLDALFWALFRPLLRISMRPSQRLSLALLAFLGLFAALPQVALAAPADGGFLFPKELGSGVALEAENEARLSAPADVLPLEDQAVESGWMDRVDEAMGTVNHYIGAVMFFDVWFWDNDSEDQREVPLAVLWLIIGAVYFTFRMGFINLRGFGHAIRVTRGDYDNPDDEGEVSHFQALASALSATVGLGNIAGVAIAVSLGGPGATFWMIAAGFLGMSSKFVECTLGQKFRKVRPDGRVMGGAMYYLSDGLAQMGLGGLGKVLAMFFAILCIGGSLGGGNTFQVNQSLNAIGEVVPFLAEHRWVYGAVMTVLVGVVILGGIKRIASTAEKIVPLMCGIYVLACVWVIVTSLDEIGGAFSAIIEGAFSPAAAYGGFIGVLVQGFKRAAFSNEAGVGSAAIAHSAAKTEYPVREGIVALLEPFIDTIVVCTMTALVIVITGAYDGVAHPEYMPYIEDKNGAGLTSLAFKSAIDWFPMVLGVAVALFAFSTMISWSYYGERCWAYLFGDGSSTIYRLLFLTFTFLGSIITAQQVLDFGDLMILGMAFPNILGVILLSGGVKRDLDDYWGKLKRGELKTFK